MRNKLLLAAAIGICVLFAQGIAVAEEPAAYVGSETCLECHEDLVATYGASFHNKAWQSTGGQEGCESCHGPGSKHADDPDLETIVSFGKDSLQSAAKRSQLCLRCHESSSELALWDMGKHMRNDVSCSDCHSIHTSNRPVPNQPETCFSCHRTIKRDSNKQSHHPIIEGKVKCSDCHNPHGTMTAKLIREDSINQLCYTCHAEKRGPFIWEHSPVAENCVTCHNPHGSRHDKLLAEKVPNICQDCHNRPRHPGTPYDGEAGFNGVSKVGRFYARSCLNCHNQIHGSDSPTNPISGSNAGKKFIR